jgi:pimeloyl-ACP methyl ester carboxylesterase
VTTTAPDLVDGLAVYRRSAEAVGEDVARVVFVHGSMDRGASFAKASRRLSDVDVVRYDRRGYGRSAGRPPDHRGAVGLGGLVDDLRTVIADRPAVVIGHSLGGVIALAAAERHPDLVQAVGAFEAPTPWKRWWPSSSAGNVAFGAGSPEEAAERFMRRIVGDEFWDRLPERTRRARRSEGEALLIDLESIRAGAPIDAGTMAATVVSGYGSCSDPRHIRAARELCEDLPNAALFTIEGAGHGAHRSHPDEFATFVRRVLVESEQARRALG